MTDWQRIKQEIEEAMALVKRRLGAADNNQDIALLEAEHGGLSWALSIVEQNAPPTGAAT